MDDDIDLDGELGSSNGGSEPTRDNALSLIAWDGIEQLSLFEGTPALGSAKEQKTFVRCPKCGFEWGGCK